MSTEIRTTDSEGVSVTEQWDVSSVGPGENSYHDSRDGCPDPEFSGYGSRC
jgi:hypothetical protein